MANTQMGAVNTNFVNSRKAVDNMGGSDTDLTTPANYVSINALRTRLTAANAYYTSDVLDNMTVNDMVFALRTLDDKTSISDYQA
jgi:hypothetical protein